LTLPLVPVFFFQAEDGIRDRNVTGVQTCALPIYLPPEQDSQRPQADQGAGADGPALLQAVPRPQDHVSLRDALGGKAGVRRQDRSEERRVGKEGRGRGWRGEGKDGGGRQEEAGRG